MRREPPRDFSRKIQNPKWYKLTIEAAKALADNRLYPALLQLQTWWQPVSDLEGALAACAPNIEDVRD
jgi:hypothetical protein